MNKTKLRVAGNILRELSEKIPSLTIAMNELVKNAYDAGSDEIYIDFDIENNLLRILDDGSGLSEKAIDELFHVSNSDKQYGVTNEYGRYTQGSKGLGFLSVFKFGDHVKWVTINEKIMRTFEVKFEELVQLDYIDEYDIDVYEENVEDSNGTTIEIKLREDEKQYLLEYFSDDKNMKRVVHSFLDGNFKISFNNCGIEYNSVDNPVDFTQILRERRLFRVKYDSSNEKIHFYHNGINVRTEDYKMTLTDVSLNIDLVIFEFKPRDKSRVDRLYISPKEQLTPLIYINNNFFNNFDIFDPSLPRATKSSVSLPQIIGNINIITSSHNMDFNSDRTNFQENSFTNSIIKFCNDLNYKIQSDGSEMKKHLRDFDILNRSRFDKILSDTSDRELQSNIKTEFYFINDVDIEKKSNKVDYKFANRVTTATFLVPSSTSEIYPAIITLNKNNDILEIPTPQINLREYVSVATDSEGKNIKDLVEIYVNSKISTSDILSSVTSPCSFIIEYKYKDSKTGDIIEQLILEFINKKLPINPASSTRSILLEAPVPSSYQITFNLMLNKLLNQINSVYSPGKNAELVGTSLRAIFEICIKEIIDNSKMSSSVNLSITDLKIKVGNVIEELSNNSSYKTLIASNLSMNYRSLDNILDRVEFERFIEKAHLGAHFSATYLSDIEIMHLGHKAAIFVVLTNEIITNNSIV